MSNLNQRISSPNLGGMTKLNGEEVAGYYVPPLPLRGGAEPAVADAPEPEQAVADADAEVAAVNTPQTTPRHTIIGPTAFIPTPSPTRQLVLGIGQMAGTKTSARSWSSKLKLVQTPHELPPARQLRDAAKAGNTAECERLLQSGVGADDSDDKYCNTSLMWAVMRGFAQTAELLLDHGASLEQANSDGWTPLVAAVWYGQTDVTRLLLARGASTAATAANEVPLTVIAAMHGNRGVLKLLLSHGVSTEGCGTDGMTALLMACEYGRADIVNELIARGASVHACCARGFNALQYAEAGTYSSIVMKLHEVDTIAQKVSEGRHSSLEHWA